MIESDIDILVEFELGKIFGLVIIRIEDELNYLLGRVVDLRILKDLSCYFCFLWVLQEVMVIYE